MKEFNHPEEYRLNINLDDDLAFKLKANTQIRVENIPAFPEGLHLRVKRLELVRKDTIATITKNLTELFNAVFIPVSKSQSRTKLYSLCFLYALLIPSGVGVFFIRGWRFGIIKRMIIAAPDQAIAPSVKKLDDLGLYIRDGIRLFGAKALYDLPKIVVLVAIGYDHIEMIIDWVYFIFAKVPGLENSQGAISDFAETSALKFTADLFIKLLFFTIASFLITPAFKITMIKYAAGKISYRRFFSLAELKDSFSIYRRYKTTTILTYLWDVFVTGLSTIIGLFLVILFPFIIWLVIPFYKLVFKHWPKAYGYGMLARRLMANGEI